MVRLQRRTSLATLTLVALSLLLGGLGFGWYVTSGMLMSIGTTTVRPPPGAAAVAYGGAWAQVYLASLLAGLVLIIFSAKGTRAICSVAIVLAALAGPLLAVAAVDLVGA